MTNKVFFVEKVVYEDNLFVPQAIFHATSAICINTIFYHYVIRKNSISHKKDMPHQKDRFLILNMLEKFFEANDSLRIYYSEFEYLWINQGLINGRKNAVNQYSKPNYSNLKYIQNLKKSKFPKYYKNQYYKQNCDLKNRLAMKIADISSIMFVKIFKIFQR